MIWFRHGEKETGGGELRVVVEGITSKGARGSRMTFVHAELATGDVGDGRDVAGRKGRLDVQVDGDVICCRPG